MICDGFWPVEPLPEGRQRDAFERVVCAALPRLADGLTPLDGGAYRAGQVLARVPAVVADVAARTAPGAKEAFLDALRRLPRAWPRRRPPRRPISPATARRHPWLLPWTEQVDLVFKRELARCLRALIRDSTSLYADELGRPPVVWRHSWGWAGSSPLESEIPL